MLGVGTGEGVGDGSGEGVSISVTGGAVVAGALTGVAGALHPAKTKNANNKTSSFFITKILAFVNDARPMMIKQMMSRTLISS